MHECVATGVGAGPGRGRPGLGMPGGRPERPGEDLPDNCKLYVAGLSESLDDSTLRSLFEPYGNVLHAAGVHARFISCVSPRLNLHRVCVVVEFKPVVIALNRDLM
jgi:RNA recognition motif-containing protein